MILRVTSSALAIVTCAAGHLHKTCHYAKIQTERNVSAEAGLVEERDCDNVDGNYHECTMEGERCIVMHRPELDCPFQECCDEKHARFEKRSCENIDGRGGKCFKQPTGDCIFLDGAPPIERNCPKKACCDEPADTSTWTVKIKVKRSVPNPQPPMPRGVEKRATETSGMQPGPRNCENVDGYGQKCFVQGKNCFYMYGAPPREGPCPMPECCGEGFSAKTSGKAKTKPSRLVLSPRKSKSSAVESKASFLNFIGIATIFVMPL